MGRTSSCKVDLIQMTKSLKHDENTEGVFLSYVGVRKHLFIGIPAMRDLGKDRKRKKGPTIVGPLRIY